MRIRLLLAPWGRTRSNCLRRLCVVQTRTGDRSGVHRSVHGFWQGPAADLPDADCDKNRPQHIPPSTVRARLHMAVHAADTFARVAGPFVDCRGTRPPQQRSLRCQLCRIYGNEASTCNVRPEMGFPNYRRTSRDGKGAAGCLRGRRKAAPSIPPPTFPHTRHRTVPLTLRLIFLIARINRREG
ncbi:structural maintenance of chromosome protein 4 [Trypanosoma cruzi]|nr:structural maintenance of chromosome protein 4 [Trypanosoma cruzi]